MECNNIACCVKGRLGRIALGAGVVALVFGLLPLVCAWFFSFTGVMWIAAVVAVAAIVMSIINKENSDNALLLGGAVLVAVALLVPVIFKKQYYSAKAELAIASLEDVVEACDTDEVIDVASEVVDDAVDVAMKAAVKYAKDADDFEDFARKQSRRVRDFDYY